MGETTINLVCASGGERCTAADDGQKVFEAVVAAIERGDNVRLSFTGVRDLTSAFLNTAIGQLYGRYPEERLRAVLLRPVGASGADLSLLKRVVRTAKAYFRNPDHYAHVVREVLEDDYA
jgi:hypothetical protein